MTIAEYDFIAQTSIVICMACLVLLLWLLRRNGPSFALPFAYLSLLLLNHIPGAVAPLMDREISGHLSEVAEGIRLTAIGVVSFLIGVWYARRQTQEQRLSPQPPSRDSIFPEDRAFWIFCLLGGWLFTFGLTPLRNLPSIGAVIYNGGAIWMLGVLLGLRWSVRNKRRGWTFIWFTCLAVYPAMILLTAGFFSYGATAALVVVCGLTVAGRAFARVFVAIGLTIYLGLSLFATYFEARDRIRNVVWSGASMERRLDAVSEIATGWKWFDATDQLILLGFDLRLNQNYFVGLAAQNINARRVDYLYGSSATDAVLALVPRALWPGKTVFGGSPEIVGKMTGLRLSSTTSFGVGNVMEFYINFGLWGLIGGFLLLGWAMGRFDHRAALAEARGDYATAILFFLPCVALIQPLGSMVELAGSASAAWLGGYFWKWGWARWKERKQASLPSAPQPVH